MKKTVALVLMVIVAGMAWSCSHAKKDADSGSVAEGASARRKVHTIALPHYQPTLPPGDGRDAFAVSCLSCHTTRYITMQPALSAAKWEESVRKMMKVYNAPIAEDQVQPIVKYLMTAKEAGPAGSWETLATTPPPVTVTLLPGALSADPSVRPTQATHGSLIFGERCASCHGLGGTSKTPAAQSMLPAPTDLTGGRYSADRLVAVIEQGVPGTAMPGYANLSQSDLRDLVLYTQRLAAPEATAAAAPASEEAKTLYAQYCMSCHGKTGAGDGYAAPPLARPPANFRLHQPTVASATRTLADGIAGTAMPAWRSKLTDAQRALLADYVRTFYVDSDSAAGQSK